MLSLSLQGLDLYIVYGILKSINSLKFLKEVDPFEWPTVKQVLQIIQEENGQHVYQGATLKNYNSFDLSLLRSLLVFVETQSWMKRSSREQDNVSMLELKKSFGAHI